MQWPCSSTCSDKWTSIQTRAQIFDCKCRDELNKLWDGLPQIVLQEPTVDIVLTDYCMPEMTGYDLLRAIKVPENHHPVPSFIWLISVESDAKHFNCQALSSPNPIPVVVMSSENEPQRISRWNSSPFPTLIIFCKLQSRCRYIRQRKAAFALWLCSVHGFRPLSES